MKKKKTSGLFLTMLPLYVFTICFVVGPLLYMIALSFATPGAGSSTIWKFTLDNYKKNRGAGLSAEFCPVFPTGNHQYFIDCTSWISFWIFYGKAV